MKVDVATVDVDVARNGTRTLLLSERGALTQYGCYMQTLLPGMQPSERHWHSSEDEFLLVLAGPVVLVEDTQIVLGSGDVACWPAGGTVGHCLANCSAAPVQYLIIGTRVQRDRIHYPDHDLIAEKDGAARVWLHLDGRVRG